MRYLLDANVLISAKRDHYRMSVCPGFWDWLNLAHSQGHVYSIKKVHDELKHAALSQWAKARPNIGGVRPCIVHAWRQIVLLGAFSSVRGFSTQLPENSQLILSSPPTPTTARRDAI